MELNLKYTSIDFLSIYVDQLNASQPLDFNLLRISPEYLIDQNRFNHSVRKLFQNNELHGFKIFY